MKLVTKLFMVIGLTLASLSFAADMPANAEQMILAAEQANAEAGKIGFEWRDTALYIAEAKKLLADSKEQEAFALAQKAYDQAILAVEQGEFMQANWEKFIPM